MPTLEMNLICRYIQMGDTFSFFFDILNAVYGLICTHLHLGANVFMMAVLIEKVQKFLL